MFLAACERAPEKAQPEPAEKSPQLVLAAVGFQDIPGWGSDTLAEAFPALERSCRRLMRVPADRAVGTAAVPMTAGDWRDACGAVLQATASGDLARVLTTEFKPFLASNNGAEEGLMTGYFEAELQGAEAPGPDFPIRSTGGPRIM